MGRYIGSNMACGANRLLAKILILENISKICGSMFKLSPIHFTWSKIV